MLRQFPLVKKEKKVALISISLCLLLSCLVFYSLAPRASTNPTSDSQTDLEKAKKLYLFYCAGCHGEKGDGLGKAAEFLYPKPRDFTKGLFKIRTTPSGSLPTDEDLLGTISQGMYGSAMPNFNFLTVDEKKALVQYLKTFSEAFQYREPESSVPVINEPPATPKTIEVGRKIYEIMECGKCHGDKGKGDGPSASTLKDDWQIPIKVRDFTTGIYKGGPTNKDLYLRFTTGMNGTPMPSFYDVFSEEEREAKLWALSAYVRSLQANQPGETSVVRANRISDPLPATPDDPVWEQARPVSIFLTGQVIASPRWQTPGVDGVTVRALHNDESVALLVEWHDPFQDTEGGGNEGDTGDTTYVNLDQFLGTAGPFPDALAVQFSQSLSEGTQKPYFFWGQAGQPVNV